MKKELTVKINSIKSEALKNGMNLTTKKNYMNKSKTVRLSINSETVLIDQKVNGKFEKLQSTSIMKFKVETINAVLKSVNKIEINKLKAKKETAKTIDKNGDDKKMKVTKNTAKKENDKNIKDLEKVTTKTLDKNARIIKNKTGKKFTIKVDIDKNDKKVFIFKNKYFKTLKEIKELIEKPIKEIGKTDQLKKRILELALKSKFTRLDFGKMIKKEFAEYKNSTLSTYISDSFNKKYFEKTGIGTLLKYKVIKNRKVIVKA